MKVERIAPTPPPPEYVLTLTSDEFQILFAALAVANFNEVERRLSSSNVVVDKARDVLYDMYNDAYGHGIGRV